MYQSVRYRLADGAILAVVQSTIDLPSQINDPATEGELTDVDAGHAVFRSQTEWIVSDGMLALKPVVTLTATKAQFAADGLESTVISHDHTAPLVVRVTPGSVHTLAVGETITMTSLIPAWFTIEVADPMLFALPLTVEAV